MSNEKFKVKFGLAVGDTAATVDGTTGDIVTTGDAAINGGDVTTTSTTGNLFNATATTVNLGGAATTVSIGANTGTTTINNSLVADDISVLTVDTTNLEVTNIKAKDGTAAATIADTTGAVSISSQLTVDNVNINGNTVSTTTGNLEITAVAGSTVNITNGSLTSPAYAIRNTASLNAIARALTLKVNNTPGTAAIGNGTSQEYEVQNSAGTSVRAGVSQVLSTNVTPGSESFNMEWALVQNGAAAATKLTLTSAGNLTATGDISATGSTSGNVTAGITTDNTVSTTTGNLLLTSSSGDVVISNNLGIGTNPAYTLDVSGSGNFSSDLRTTGGITIRGSSSGQSSFSQQASGPSIGYNLPTAQGAASTVLTNDGSGVLTWALPGGGGSTFGNVSIGVDTDQTISTSSGNLILQTAAGVNAGTVTLASGTNGAITIVPNGTGNLALTASNGGNLTNTRNYVFGAIRNSTTQSIGDIWALNSTGTVQPVRGVSLDNSSDTAKLPGYLARTYSNTAGFRSRVIFERARFTGTVATPAAVQSGDFLGDVAVSGYTSTGWVNDNIIAAGAVPGLLGFTATENWTSNTNLGTSFAVTLAPSATTITSGANLVPTITSSPQVLTLRQDRFAVSQGKTAAFVATGCSTSGTTLTIGTVTSGTVAIGQVLTGFSAGFGAAYIIANISGSGSGSTWTLSETPGTTSAQTLTGYAGFIATTSAANTTDILQDLKLITNKIKGSTGTTQVTTSASGTTLALAGDTVNFNNAAATNLMNLTQESVTGGTNTSLTLLKTNATGTSTAEVATVNLTSYRTTGASQSGDKLGQFKFNGSSATGVVAGPVGSFQVYAAETFTGSAQGGRAIVQINKTGTTSSYNVLDLQSSNAIINADALALNDSSAVGLVGSKISYNRVYGAFQYNTTVTPAAANTAYVFPIGTVDFNNIVTVGSTSRIIIGAAGLYNLQFSVQVENTVNAEHVAYIWIRKNGVDVTGSMGRINIPKSGATIAGWNYVISSANTTDYYELAYAVEDTAVIFPAYAATAFGPSTASLITTITPVGA